MIIMMFGVDETDAKVWKRMTKPVKKFMQMFDSARRQVSLIFDKKVEKVGKTVERLLNKNKWIITKVFKEPLQRLIKSISLITRKKRITFVKKAKNSSKKSNNQFSLIIKALKKKEFQNFRIYGTTLNHEENAPDNEPFNTKLLRLHNELRT